MGWDLTGILTQRCMPSHCPNGVRTCGNTRQHPQDWPIKNAPRWKTISAKTEIKSCVYFFLRGPLLQFDRILFLKTPREDEPVAHSWQQQSDDANHSTRAQMVTTVRGWTWFPRSCALGGYRRCRAQGNTHNYTTDYKNGSLSSSFVEFNFS